MDSLYYSAGDIHSNFDEPQNHPPDYMNTDEGKKTGPSEKETPGKAECTAIEMRHLASSSENTDEGKKTGPSEKETPGKAECTAIEMRHLASSSENTDGGKKTGQSEKETPGKNECTFVEMENLASSSEKEATDYGQQNNNGKSERHRSLDDTSDDTTMEVEPSDPAKEATDYGQQNNNGKSERHRSLDDTSDDTTMEVEPPDPADFTPLNRHCDYCENTRKEIRDKEHVNLRLASRLNECLKDLNDKEHEIKNRNKEIKVQKSNLATNKTQIEQLLKEKQDYAKLKKYSDEVTRQKNELEKKNKADMKKQSDDFKKQQSELKIVKKSLNGTSDERDDLKNKLSQRELYINQLQNNISSLEYEKTQILKEYRKRMEQINYLESQNQQLQNSLDDAEQKREDAQNRLSRLAGQIVRHDNPAITDLSDINRPEKLKEKMRALYDSEWTDLFEVLQETHEEEFAIQFLLEILQECYCICERARKLQNNVINDALVDPFHLRDKSEDEEHLSASSDSALTTIEKSEYFNWCKKHGQTSAEVAEKVCLEKVKNYVETHHPKIQQDILTDYIKKCGELCWWMCLNNPPLALVCCLPENRTFSPDLYKEYTSKGKYVKFIVWPALIQTGTDQILERGVAQGTSKNPLERSKMECVEEQSDRPVSETVNSYQKKMDIDTDIMKSQNAPHTECIVTEKVEARIDDDEGDQQNGETQKDVDKVETFPNNNFTTVQSSRIVTCPAKQPDTDNDKVESFKPHDSIDNGDINPETNRENIVSERDSRLAKRPDILVDEVGSFKQHDSIDNGDINQETYSENIFNEKDSGVEVVGNCAHESRIFEDRSNENANPSNHAKLYGTHILANVSEKDTETYPNTKKNEECVTGTDNSNSFSECDNSCEDESILTNVDILHSVDDTATQGKHVHTSKFQKDGLNSINNIVCGVDGNVSEENPSVVERKSDLDVHTGKKIGNKTYVDKFYGAGTLPQGNKDRFQSRYESDTGSDGRTNLSVRHSSKDLENTSLEDSAASTLGVSVSNNDDGNFKNTEKPHLYPQIQHSHLYSMHPPDSNNTSGNAELDVKSASDICSSENASSCKSRFAQTKFSKNNSSSLSDESQLNEKTNNSRYTLNAIDKESNKTVCTQRETTPDATNSPEISEASIKDEESDGDVETFSSVTYTIVEDGGHKSLIPVKESNEAHSHDLPGHDTSSMKADEIIESNGDSMKSWVVFPEIN